MLTISQDLCSRATKNGSFRVQDLYQGSPLTYDDMVFLSEYLKVTPLTQLDLSLSITRENIYGLSILSDVIAQKKT